MIRFIFDKARVASTLSFIKNVIKPAIPLQNFRLLSNQISKSAAPDYILSKDVIVYKYDNPRFFKLMNIFAISQFIFWGKHEES